MKITKQRLKKIIREELTNLEAPGLGKDVRFTTVEGAREDMMMPAISTADMEAAMTTDEPRREGGTPEEKFLNKLTIVAHAQGAKTGADAAELFGLGDDPEVIAYLDGLIGNPMYRS